jgi:hypothetical protein
MPADCLRRSKRLYIASPLIALLPAAHLPVRDPKNLSRLGTT